MCSNTCLSRQKKSNSDNWENEPRTEEELEVHNHSVKRTSLIQHLLSGINWSNGLETDSQFRAIRSTQKRKQTQKEKREKDNMKNKLSTQITNKIITTSHNDRNHLEEERWMIDKGGFYSHSNWEIHEHTCSIPRTHTLTNNQGRTEQLRDQNLTRTWALPSLFIATHTKEGEPANPYLTPGF